MRLCSRGNFTWAVLGVLLACGPLGALAAERCVLIEDFTAIWCDPCHVAGGYLNQLQNNYPNTVAVLQEHILNDDPYGTSWGNSRCIAYGNSKYIPNMWWDGVIQYVGSGSYQIFYNYYNARHNLPADVIVEVGGVPDVQNPAKYYFRVRVSLEPTGTQKTVRIYLARALDHWPAGADYNRNCFREAAATQDVTLAPGQYFEMERTMTFPNTTYDPSWSHQTDIRIFAWAQVPGATGPREVYQTKQIAWPIQPLPPMYAKGDLNCDGTIDFGDIDPFVLALSDPTAYEQQYPNCDKMLADINEDGSVNFGDIDPFVALLSGG